MTIELNKTYNSFDDGKIRETRMFSVVITEIIPFKDASKELIDLWEEEIKGMEHLFLPETDYFLKGFLNDEWVKNEKQEVFYVRAKCGWFGLGYFGGQLDHDGSLLKSIQDKIN